MQHNFYEDYTEAKSFLTSYHADCRDWRDFYNGEHWSHVSGVDANASQPEVNYIKPNVQQLLAMLQLQHPSILVNPTKKEGAATAEILTGALKSLYEAKDVAEDVKRASLDMLIYGRGYQGILWDASDEGGRGNIGSYTISPFNLYPSPLSHTIDEAEYVHVRHLRSPYYVYTKYGVEVQEDATDEFTNAKGVEIVESWYNPDATIPNGRHLIWAASMPTKPFVDEELPYPFRCIPIVDYVVDDTSTGERYSMVGDMWGTQKLYMKILGYLCDNMMLSQNCQWKTTDTDLPEELPNKPGYVHHVQGMDTLLPMMTPQLNTGWFDLPEMLRSIFPDLSGVRQVNMGSTASGVTAASAIVALQEAGKTIKELKADGIQRAVSKWGLMAVELMRWYTAEHWQDIAGSIPDPASMDSPYDVSVEYCEALPTDKASRLNIAKVLVDSHILDAQAFAAIIGDPTLIAEIEKSQGRLA
ncbi:MAG TPA: hypothetical protein PLO19_07380, partial [Candidatus Cryosericum sp.]|nr:hypothetical protein [Candidatus Cryosericum sp.]